MQTKPKANSVITSRSEGTVIIFTVAGAGELQLDTAKLSDAVRAKAIQHGLVQRISDAAAIGFIKDENRYATPAEKLAAMKELVEHYNSGTAEWSRTRASGPRIGDDSALLVKCLARIYAERTEEQLRAWVAKRSRSERTALLLSEKIKPIADELRAQAASANAEDLILDLETMDDTQGA